MGGIGGSRSESLGAGSKVVSSGVPKQAVWYSWTCKDVIKCLKGDLRQQDHSVVACDALCRVNHGAAGRLVMAEPHAIITHSDSRLPEM